MEKTSIRTTKKGDALIVKIGDQSAIFSTNLIKYHLGLEYTKKNGQVVTIEEIAKKRQRAQDLYIAAIKSNKKAQA